MFRLSVFIVKFKIAHNVSVYLLRRLPSIFSAESFSQTWPVLTLVRVHVLGAINQDWYNESFEYPNFCTPREVILAYVDGEANHHQLANVLHRLIYVLMSLSILMYAPRYTNFAMPDCGRSVYSSARHLVSSVFVSVINFVSLVLNLVSFTAASKILNASLAFPTELVIKSTYQPAYARTLTVLLKIGLLLSSSAS